ncbi:MAG: autotransporter strand-loop-strand O-heptosyltransferase [Candidatus Schekmanbacteria bacterium]|nr:autotransporter strand-loop-strand O-heptosyltransferase [Candidatus Schekmanbacteria bacterium]
MPVTFQCHFIDGPCLTITGEDERPFTVELIDLATGEIVYQVDIGAGQWARANRRWFTSWLVRVRREQVVVFEHVFDARGKRVYIALESKSLGDTLAWMPYAEVFADKHQCELVVSTFWNDLFRDAYGAFTFVAPGERVDDLYAMFQVGYFTPPWGGDRARNPVDFRSIPLQKAASDILGLDFVERRPKLVVPPWCPAVAGRYACISEHSTAGAKLWHCPGGWQDVVDALRDRGYEVVAISKEATALPGVLDHTGDRPIQRAMADLSGSSLYIGLASGLSWLAWSLGVPVIMISGFSAPWAELSSNVVRLHNPHVCHSCWNDLRFEFDKNDWNWCPVHKGTARHFECSRAISAADVIRAIDLVAALRRLDCGPGTVPGLTLHCPGSRDG